MVEEIASSGLDTAEDHAYSTLLAMTTLAMTRCVSWGHLLGEFVGDFFGPATFILE